MSNALEKLPREKLARMAMNMRRRARNEAMNQKLMFKRVLNIGVGGGAAFLMGGYMASKQKEYLKLASTNPDKAKKEDPRQLMGIDTEIVVGGAASLGGVLLQGKSGTRFWGELGESAGLGVLCFYAGKRGFDAEMKKSGSALTGE